MSHFIKLTKLSFLFFLILGASNCYAQDTLTLADDRTRLIEFFQSTNGANWKVKTNWNTAADVSTWYGVTVFNGRVTAINLPGNNLTGTLPATIRYLTQLQDLYLGQNSISGSIPAEVGSISTLVGLNLDDNDVTGPIPSSLGSLSNLVYLSLGGNALSGNLPPELGNLPAIQSLYLWNNRLEGTLPSTLGNLTTLQRFHIQGNLLSGAVPTQFNNLDALLELQLAHNNLTDLPDLTGMASITTFHVEGNRLTFADVVPNATIPGFIYSSMQSILLTGSKDVTVGNPLQLEVLSEAGNVVQWTRDGVPVGSDATYSVSAASPADAGYYDVVITNPNAAALTLRASPNAQQNGITVTVYSLDAATDAGYNVGATIGAKSLGIYEPSPGRMATNNTVIYIHNETAGRIDKLNMSGDLISSVEVFGTGIGKVSCISDLEVDPGGSLYISSECESKVMKFNANGALEYEITGTGGSLGLAFDAASNLYVLSRTGEKIWKYNSTTKALMEEIMLSGVPSTYALDLEFDNDGDFVVYDPSTGSILKYSGTTRALIMNMDLNDPAIGIGTWSSFFIAIGSNDHIYLQGFQGWVAEFDNAGNYIRTFGTSETLYNPVGIAGLSDGILVSDMIHGLLLYNNDGTFSRRIDGGKDAAGQFYVPKKIAMDSKYNRYVCDYYNGRIQKFNSKGTFIMSIGSLGTGVTQLKYPQSIAIDGNDVIYVADERNNRIQKFSADGTHLGSIGTAGTGNGQFNTPRSVAISKTGFLYVVDALNYRIQKFKRDGSFVMAFGSQGSGPGKFTLPRNIAVEDDGSLLISDQVRLLRYNENGQFVNEIPVGNTQIAELSTDNFGYIYASFGSLVNINEGGCYTRKYDKFGGVVTTINNALYVSSNPTGDTLWVAGTPHFVSIIYPNDKPALSTDRAVLEELYNSTNGPQWTNRNNWLSNNPINTWYGVSVSAGKIMSIDLSDNNLQGQIPASITTLKTLSALQLNGNKLAGELPSALAELKVLQLLNVANNELSGAIPTLPLQLVKANFQNNKFTAINSVSPFLTDLNVSDNTLASLGNFNGSSLEILLVNGNNLSFQDLAQNVGIGNYDYLDQGRLGEPNTQLIDVGSNYTLQMTTPGAGNIYTWKKAVGQDTVAVAGANAAEYVLTSIGRANMGVYVGEVTNPVLPGLTLKTFPQTIWATANLSGRLLTAPDEAATQGTVSLYKVNEETAFTQIGPNNINPDGTYRFEKVILADYQLIGYADPSRYENAIPTYYGGSSFWELADTLYINEHRNDLDILSEFKPDPPTSGNGSIAGTLYEDPELSGGKTQAKEPVKKAGASVRRAQSSGRPKEGQEEYELVDYKFTDDLGEFSFNNLEQGTYWLNLQYPGYPMDSTSFIKITVGSGLKDRSIMVEAEVLDKKIVVRQLIILGWEDSRVDLQAYPNPTATTLFIGGVNDRSATFSVIDMQGKQEKCEAKFDRDANLWAIDVAHLPPGTYAVKIKSKSTNHSVRIAIK